MMRINLLPPEILERRRSEKRLGWVALAALLVAIVLAGVWVFAYMGVQGKRNELASVRQQVQSTQAQAQQLAIFEQRATELETRRAIAAAALDDRRNWARLFDETSLVLPADVWIETLSASEETGLQVDGWALDAAGDSPDGGHKSIAKVLVRLTDLDQLYNVWLTSSAKQLYLDQDAIQFTVTADVVAPGAESETP